MIAFLLMLTLQLQAPPSAGCTPPEVQALEAAERLVRRGDDEAVRKELGVSESADRCRLTALARLSRQGWIEARSLAPKGGPRELLGPVNQMLSELERLKSDDVAIEAEYATSAIRAAVAAAQDERGEMELWLRHARDLAERLAARDRRAVWPLPFNLVAGELWFEVDRYDEARLAFERAVRAERDGVALIGLARAHARLGNKDEACRAYRLARDVAAPLATEARTFLAGCP